ncbi:hypothetical protein MMC11_003421 [Xylographa trunciseda]|nr:hypothetical protein [Xylographa trunciseda]
MADLSRCLPLERSSVEGAHELIKPYIHETPVLTCQTLNDLASTPQSPSALSGTHFEGQRPAAPKINFFFKCENYQRIGAFKIRGASYALECLSKDELRNGVVTHSSGNHAQALALAARTRHVRAHIVMPTISTPSKIAATQGYGAEVIFSGSTSEEREAVVEDVIQRTGATLVPPYDHPDIILGQGTMALELEAQVRELVRKDPALSVRSKNTPHGNGSVGAGKEDNGISDDRRNGNTTQHETLPKTKGIPSACIPPSQRSGHYPHLHAVLAPLGGGGMLSGVATALAPTPTLVFGAEPSFQGADDGRRGLLQHKRIESVKTLTIADGLRTPLSPLTWSIVSDKSLVEGVYAVSEEQIKRAMRLVFERMKVVVEPSAVVGLAVALWDEGFRRVVEEKGGERGWDVGVVFSGGNVGVEALGELFAGGKEEGTEGEREVGKLGTDGARVAENVAG